MSSSGRAREFWWPEAHCLQSLHLANFGLQKVPGFRGRVRRVSFDFTIPRLILSDVLVANINDGQAEQVLEVGSLIITTHWKDIFTGALITDLRVESPKLLLDLSQLHQHDENRNGKSQPGGTSKAKQQPWQEKVKQMPAFKISSLVLTNGEVHLHGIPGQGRTDIQIQDLNVSLDNITNSTRLSPTLKTAATCRARVMADGSLEINAEGYPLAAAPTFNVDFQTSNVDLTEFRNLIENNIEVDVRRGILDLYIEAAAAEGRIGGYAKPIFDHLELEALKNSRFIEKVKAWAAEAVLKLGRNKRKDRVATRLDCEGALDDPDLNVTDAVLRFFRNSFRAAERASLDHRIWFSKAGKTAGDVDVHLGNEPRSKTATVLSLLKETYSRWSEDSAPRMAAALSYYTAFSMAPLLILAISIASLVLGQKEAQGKIVEQIGGLVGKQSAAAIQGMIQASNHPSKGILAGVIGIVSLLAGAIGVLSELKSALNKIWRTEERGGVKEIVKKNVVFVGMLLGIGFLLTVSLVVSAGVAGLGKFLGGQLPAPELLLQAANFVLSVGIIAMLFAAIYRFLPNTKVEWHDVWVGAIGTSFLFNLGKLGLGLYIGKSAVASSYGATGSILVLLLWVYYSGLIFYFGAEFTRIYADRCGSRKIDKKRFHGTSKVAR